jgi:putative nucleotidyltransferase with HDIG domain
MEGLDNSITALGMGALLHDVGKTRLPRNLICKPTAYTDQERRLMERHPTLGATILRRSENIPELAQRIAAEHHERIDGSGYPCGIRGAELLLPSQLVAITDLYDNMLTGRNRPALQPIEVLRQLYLRSNAGALDRRLVEKVIHCLGVYPIGSLVELNTGERGIVIASNRVDSLKPTLRLVSSRGGVTEPTGPVVNLAESDSDAVERRIFRALDPEKEQIDFMTGPDMGLLFSA